MPGSSPDRLDELLCRLVDGFLTDHDAKELEGILREDAEARERYRVFSAAHLLLAAGHHESAGKITPIRRGRGFMSPLTIAAAAVAVLAAGINFWQSSRVRPHESPLAADDTGKSKLAVVARAEDAVWNLPQPAAGGATILTGQPVSLKEGLVVLELIGGQILTLRAPASFSLIGEREMALKEGDASLRGKEGRSPYVIQVPGGAVVDLGTEFSVNVSAGGTSDVRVFQGTANASITGLAGSTREERLLNAGESVRITKTLEDSPKVPADFVRPLPPDPLETSPAGEAYADAVKQSAPLAWWRFDRAEDKGMVLPEAGNHPLVLSGGPVLAGPQGRRFFLTDAKFASGYAITREVITGLDTPQGFTMECLLHPTSESYSTALILDEPRYEGSIKPQFARLKHPPQRMGIERMGLRGSKIGHLHPDFALRAMMRSPAGYDGEINNYSAESYLLYRWVHVAYTYDGAVLRLFIDGKLSDKVEARLPFQGAALRPIIGRLQPLADGEHRQWSGGIDEVALYARALSAEEVQAHAAALEH